ncbi:hypothetical protein LCGC14_0826630 [marine sediment metagenome]|uniref:Lipoprotein n=1 Tax=marine sediment metagenome TaxID=412755 RepID=A0A0F9PLV1_9ZZZZ
MKKKLMIVLIMLTFTLIACAGPQRISIRQCKEVGTVTTECMSTEILGDFSMLPF